MNAQREKMQSLVSRWRDSGLSQAEYARKNELNLQTFRYWISKFRKDEDDAPAFIALDGFAPTQISLHYPNVELILPAQTPVSVFKGLIHFDARCYR
jgi:hypothetical protein